jgi:hypothetical protein
MTFPRVKYDGKKLKQQRYVICYFKNVRNSKGQKVHFLGTKSLKIYLNGEAYKDLDEMK